MIPGFNDADPNCIITNTRIIQVPRELVFKAWTDPIHLQNWWGPKGFTNTFQEFDLRPGGRWRFTMHGPDKGHYKNECEFTVIEPPSLVAWKRHSKPLFQVAVRFEEVAPAQTKLIFQMIFDTAEECNKLRPYVVEKNEENFDKLEVELKKIGG